MLRLLKYPTVNKCGVSLLPPSCEKWPCCEQMAGRPFRFAPLVACAAAIHAAFGLPWDLASMEGACCGGRPSCGWRGLRQPLGLRKTQTATTALSGGWRWPRQLLEPRGGILTARRFRARIWAPGSYGARISRSGTSYPCNGAGKLEPGDVIVARNRAAVRISPPGSSSVRDMQRYRLRV